MAKKVNKAKFYIRFKLVLWFSLIMFIAFLVLVYFMFSLKFHNRIDIIVYQYQFGFGILKVVGPKK